jgi:hypothetical protein
MVGNQIDTLTFDPFFNHNLCRNYSNGQCKPILNTYVLIVIQYYKSLFNPMNFGPPESFSKNLGVN